MKYNLPMLKRLRTYSLSFSIVISNELNKILQLGFVEVCDCFILKKQWLICNQTEENRQRHIKHLQEIIIREDQMRVEWDYNDICIFPIYADHHILENSIIFTDLLLKQWSKEHPDKKLIIGVNITEDLDDGDPLELTKLKIFVERPSSSPFFENIENDNGTISLLVANSFDDLDLVNEVKRLQSYNAL